MAVGYLPDMFGHVAQMPQLLARPASTHAVVWRGVPARRRPHRVLVGGARRHRGPGRVPADRLRQRRPHAATTRARSSPGSTHGSSRSATLVRDDAVLLDERHRPPPPPAAVCRRGRRPRSTTATAGRFDVRIDLPRASTWPSAPTDGLPDVAGRAAQQRPRQPAARRRRPTGSTSARRRRGPSGRSSRWPSRCGPRFAARRALARASAGPGVAGGGAQRRPRLGVRLLARRGRRRRAPPLRRGPPDRRTRWPSQGLRLDRRRAGRRRAGRGQHAGPHARRAGRGRPGPAIEPRAARAAPRPRRPAGCSARRCRPRPRRAVLEAELDVRPPVHGVRFVDARRRRARASHLQVDRDRSRPLPGAASVDRMRALADAAPDASCAVHVARRARRDGAGPRRRRPRARVGAGRRRPRRVAPVAVDGPAHWPTAWLTVEVDGRDRDLRPRRASPASAGWSTTATRATPTTTARRDHDVVVDGPRGGRRAHGRGRAAASQPASSTPATAGRERVDDATSLAGGRGRRSRCRPCSSCGPASGSSG